MAADNAAACLVHLRETAAENLFENCGIALFRKAYDGKRRDWPAAHGIYVAERVGRGYLTEQKGIVHDRGEKIDGLHERYVFGNSVNSGVVIGVEANQDIGIRLPRQLSQHRVKRGGI